MVSVLFVLRLVGGVILVVWIASASPLAGWLTDGFVSRYCAFSSAYPRPMSNSLFIAQVRIPLLMILC